MQEMKFKAKFDERSTFWVATSAVTLPDILLAFRDFLKGCGYVFDGDLEIVPEDMCEKCREEDDEQE